MGLRTGLTDLNELLFEQLERLGNEDLTGEALQAEIARSKAVTQVADTIVNNASLCLKAAELSAEYNRTGTFQFPLIENGTGTD